MPGVTQVWWRDKWASNMVWSSSISRSLAVQLQTARGIRLRQQKKLDRDSPAQRFMCRLGEGKIGENKRTYLTTLQLLTPPLKNERQKDSNQPMRKWRKTEGCNFDWAKGATNGPVPRPFCQVDGTVQSLVTRLLTRRELRGDIMILRIKRKNK